MAALIDIVKKGSTDRSVTLCIIDSTDGTKETGVTSASAGLALWYRREAGTVVGLTESDLVAVDSAHSDGGMKHISDGEYRVDYPDAAFATGANYVDVGGAVTGMIVIGGRVRLIDFDIESATQPVNVTAIDAAIAAKIADILLRRTNASVEASSNGDALSVQSLYALVAMLTNGFDANTTPGTLYIKKADKTSNLGSQALTGDASANAVVKAVPV